MSQYVIELRSGSYIAADYVAEVASADTPDEPPNARSSATPGVAGHPAHVNRYRGIVADIGRERDEWITALRKAGVKAAHPDDGWVDRVSNRVLLVYPQFVDSSDVGDVMALGWPEQYRLVRITRVDPNPIGFIHHYFEDIVRNTTPFDTERLDEECERIAAEIYAEDNSRKAFGPHPYAGYPGLDPATGGMRVRGIILGHDRMWERHILEWVLRRCRRPKFVVAP